MISNILAKIQTELKANKGQTNKFGGYSYRSCEDILESVKPLLRENGASLVISDEIVMVGDRIYVKATAKFTVGEESIESTAFAREPEAQKGMSPSQVTGSASSYARKYSLNGMFAIDDSKDDPDMRDNREESGPNKSSPKKPNPKKPSSFKKPKEVVETKEVVEEDSGDGWS